MLYYTLYIIECSPRLTCQINFTHVSTLQINFNLTLSQPSNRELFETAKETFCSRFSWKGVLALTFTLSEENQHYNFRNTVDSR